MFYDSQYLQWTVDLVSRLFPFDITSYFDTSTPICDMTAQEIKNSISTNLEKLLNFCSQMLKGIPVFFLISLLI